MSSAGVAGHGELGGRVVNVRGGWNLPRRMDTRSGNGAACCCGAHARPQASVRHLARAYTARFPTGAERMLCTVGTGWRLAATWQCGARETRERLLRKACACVPMACVDAWRRSTHVVRRRLVECDHRVVHSLGLLHRNRRRRRLAVVDTEALAVEWQVASVAGDMVDRLLLVSVRIVEVARHVLRRRDVLLGQLGRLFARAEAEILRITVVAVVVHADPAIRKHWRVTHRTTGGLARRRFPPRLRARPRCGGERQAQCTFWEFAPASFGPESVIFLLTFASRVNNTSSFI